MTTLMVELALVRVFDVIWHANMAYMIITMVMFCFGLSGVFLSLWPVSEKAGVHRLLTILAVIFGISVIAPLPVLNNLPINFSGFYASPLKTSVMFLLMYFFLALPFFIAGLILTIIFSCYSSKIQKLYFWDLLGAAIGCLILIPFLPVIGPGGVLFVGCGAGFIAAALFSSKKATTALLAAAGIIFFIVPFYRSLSSDNLADRYFEFKHHIAKRGVKGDIAKGRLEVSYWDPISKVDIIDQQRWKHVAYDGGSQSSFIFPFDGDYEALRRSLPESTGKNFGGQNVYISHAIKEGTKPNVLVIGSAAGQETKAALTFGASHVDAVEMVGFVLKAGKELYQKYNGGIYTDPRVSTHRAEGRSFLRSSSQQYDIIQIYSNHTSSSIAAGSGAMATTYLQTTEAYKEYFTHLADDGILHINHHVYPRMITTAARAWKELGRKNFRAHVLVFSVKNIRENLPTLLIRMTPWTEAEVTLLRSWFWGHTEMVEDPFLPGKSMLSDEFYSGDISAETAALVPFRVVAATDDRPYFNFLRKEWVRYKRAYPEKYMDYSTAALLSSQYVVRSPVTKQYETRLIPTDVVHLFVTSGASIVFACLFIFLPLLFARAGRVRWPYKFHSLGYFSCLGAGFIMIELVFIQIFMKLIGFPLYTYSVVVFALLVAAGLGSYCSSLLKITPARLWGLPFAGLLLSTALFLLIYQPYFTYFLTLPLAMRILAAIVLLVPPGFFMGMCFPLGILTIKDQPSGAVAWAWGMNGLFTVIGGILSVIISIYLGFSVTLLCGMSIYLLACLLYFNMRKLSLQPM
jgi:hypothetical protein